jgi:ferrous-iron efflux pump FieF
LDIKQKASLSAIIMAALLAGSKFAVGLISGSMAVASSALDSLLDAFMSGMNFYAIRKAAEPADQIHPYGHAKAEDVAAGAQSLVILFTGGYIIYESVDKYLNHATITYSIFDIAVMVLSLVFSLVISTVLRKVARKTDSHVLKADALHYTSDLYSNSAAIVAILLTKYTGHVYFDLLFAVIIGIIIAVSALGILRSGLAGLMDMRIPEKMEREIAGIIIRMPYPYAGYHKFRSRLAGSRKYIDFHLLTCRQAHVDEAHELADRIEQKIEETASPVDVTIHIEPCAEKCELTTDTCSIPQVRSVLANNVRT